MPNAGDGAVLEVALHASSVLYASEDLGWRRQVHGLYQALRNAATPLRRYAPPMEGKKGGDEVLILALGTSGAITAAVQVFKAWLARSQDRELRLVFDDGRSKVTVTVTGSNIDVATLESTLKAALERLGRR